MELVCLSLVVSIYKKFNESRNLVQPKFDEKNPYFLPFSSIKRAIFRKYQKMY